MFRQHRLFRRPTQPGRRRHADAELQLRQTEIRLLRRQNWASWATVFSTVLLSAALLTLTYFQWQTSESTAAIERAKARPHFRIRQQNQHDELGFLPREFAVQADAGVSDATEAAATSVMLIHYQSRDLGISGICRATFVNFYGWTNDALSFELADAADRLMTVSRTPDTVSEAFIRIQPLWVLVDVSFTDIFSEPGHQTLQLFAGQAARLDSANRPSAIRSGMELNLQVDSRGKIVVYRVSTEPASPDCVGALRVMNRMDALLVARDYAMPRDQAYLIVRNPDLEADRGRPITATDPAPTILPFGDGGTP